MPKIEKRRMNLIKRAYFAMKDLDSPKVNRNRKVLWRIIKWDSYRKIWADINISAEWIRCIVDNSIKIIE